MYFDEAAKLLTSISPATIAHIKAVDTSLSFTFPIQVFKIVMEEKRWHNGDYNRLQSTPL